MKIGVSAIYYWHTIGVRKAYLFTKSETMQKLLAILALVVFLASCKAVSPSEAASGRYKHCRAIR